MKEGYEPEVINEDTDESSSSTDEDFDFEKERSRNDDSDGEFKAHSRYTTSEDSESRRYRTRNSVDTRKKPEQSTITTTTTTKDIERRKERSSSSDEDGDGIRPVKNFMASTSMPLTNEPEEEKRKSIRKMYGKNEAVYIMDAKKAGNIGRYFNVSADSIGNIFSNRYLSQINRLCCFCLCSIHAVQICLFKTFSSILMICDFHGWHSLHRHTYEPEQSSHGITTMKWAAFQIKF